VTKEGYMTDREQFPVAVPGITVWAEERQTLSPGHYSDDKRTNQFFTANSSSMDVG